MQAVIAGEKHLVRGTRASSSTVSNLNKKIYASIEARRMRPIEGEHPHLYLGGIVLKRNGEGLREILGICEGG